MSSILYGPAHPLGNKEGAIPGINVVIRESGLVVDLEDEKTRRIRGSFTVSKMGEYGRIQNLRGKDVLKIFTRKALSYFFKETGLKRVEFIMEVGLYDKFNPITNIDLRVKDKTKVEGKDAYLIEVRK